MNRQPRNLADRRSAKAPLAAGCLLAICCVLLTPHAVTAPLAEGLAEGGDAHTPAYITFCVNMHGFIHVDECANAILGLIDLFESHSVCGGFYFTSPIIRAHEEERPDVLNRLRGSGMTISYHIRPPHPAYRGFDGRLEELDPTALDVLLRDYGTYRLDLATGGRIYDESGGMTHLIEVFGQAPRACSIPFERWRPVLLPSGRRWAGG